MWWHLKPNLFINEEMCDMSLINILLTVGLYKSRLVGTGSRGPVMTAKTRINRI